LAVVHGHADVYLHDCHVDLLVELNEKDKVAGKPVAKPELNRRLPFPGNFEVFLMTWNFLNVFS
jgi:hypothetical protein